MAEFSPRALEILNTCMCTGNIVDLQLEHVRVKALQLLQQSAASIYGRSGPEFCCFWAREEYRFFVTKKIIIENSHVMGIHTCNGVTSLGKC